MTRKPEFHCIYRINVNQACVDCIAIRLKCQASDYMPVCLIMMLKLKF